MRESVALAEPEESRQVERLLLDLSTGFVAMPGRSVDKAVGGGLQRTVFRVALPIRQTA
jgi:hypothetical protein